MKKEIKKKWWEVFCFDNCENEVLLCRIKENKEKLSHIENNNNSLKNKYLLLVLCVMLSMLFMLYCKINIFFLYIVLILPLIYCEINGFSFISSNKDYYICNEKFFNHLGDKTEKEQNIAIFCHTEKYCDIMYKENVKLGKKLKYVVRLYLLFALISLFFFEKLF